MVVVFIKKYYHSRGTAEVLPVTFLPSLPPWRGSCTRAMLGIKRGSVV